MNILKPLSSQYFYYARPLFTKQQELETASKDSPNQMCRQRLAAANEEKRLLGANPKYTFSNFGPKCLTHRC